MMTVEFSATVMPSPANLTLKPLCEQLGHFNVPSAWTPAGNSAPDVANTRPSFSVTYASSITRRSCEYVPSGIPDSSAISDTLPPVSSRRLM
jgi:hypothetical protein